MTKPKATQADSKAKKAIDALVKKDVDALRVRSKVNAGIDVGCHKCGCMPTGY